MSTISSTLVSLFPGRSISHFFDPDIFHNASFCWCAKLDRTTKRSLSGHQDAFRMRAGFGKAMVATGAIVVAI